MDKLSKQDREKLYQDIFDLHDNCLKRKHLNFESGLRKIILLDESAYDEDEGSDCSDIDERELMEERIKEGDNKGSGEFGLPDDNEQEIPDEFKFFQKGNEQELPDDNEQELPDDNEDKIAQWYENEATTPSDDNIEIPSDDNIEIPSDDNEENPSDVVEDDFSIIYQISMFIKHESSMGVSPQKSVNVITFLHECYKKRKLADYTIQKPSETDIFKCLNIKKETIDIEIIKYHLNMTSVYGKKSLLHSYKAGEFMENLVWKNNSNIKKTMDYIRLSLGMSRTNCYRFRNFYNLYKDKQLFVTIPITMTSLLSYHTSIERVFEWKRDGLPFLEKFEYLYKDYWFVVGGLKIDE